MSAQPVTYRGPLGEVDGGWEEHADVVRWATPIDAYTNFMVAGGLSVRTISLRRYQMRRVAAANLRRSPWRVSTTDLVTWLASHPHWSAEHRRSYRNTLRSFYGWAVDAGHVKKNPAAGLPAVKVPFTLPRPTPDAALVVALASASDRDRLILALAAYAGLRRAEIAGLRWDDITTGGIRVRGKGGRVRRVPLHPELERELLAELERRDAGSWGTGYRYGRGCECGCVFPGQSGGPMTPAAVGEAAKRALGGAWGAHSLRHRFATNAYAGTRDLLAVQSLLGHAKPETTIRYTELADGALAAAVRAV